MIEERVVLSDLIHSYILCLVEGVQKELISQSSLSIFLQNRANIVPQPMIGGSSMNNRNGPWPECVGMTGDDCASMIRSVASDLSPSNVVVMNVNSMMTMDYRTDRVRIMVDDDGKVVRSPSRG